MESTDEETCFERTPLLSKARQGFLDASTSSLARAAPRRRASSPLDAFDCGNGLNVNGVPVADDDDDDSTSEGSCADLAVEEAVRKAFPNDYASICWVRDSLNDRARVRALRQQRGVRGFWANTWDSAQGVSSGLIVGQQGPLVHISCCIGNIYSRFFPKYASNQGKLREILSAATAAGVSVAFAAPIGGVLFSLEEVSYYFPLKTLWRSFFCTLTAVVTLKLMNPYGSGKLVKFQVVYSHDWKDFELIPFALLGVFGGIYGACYIRFTNFLAALRRTRYFPVSPVSEVLVIAFFTAALNHNTPLLRLSLNEIKEVLFSECVAGREDAYGLCSNDNLDGVLSILYSLLAVKLGLVLFSNGLRVPGGIVGSSMLIGACFGRIVGTFILKLQMEWGSQCVARDDCVAPGIYALVGGAAALCGVSRMTVSLVVVMLELTGALKLVLPLMIAITIAKWTAERITRDSSYDATIKRNGFPYLDHKRDYYCPGPASGVIYAGEVAEHDSVATFQVGVEYSWDEVQQKLDILARLDDCGFAVLHNQSLLGYIPFQDVRFACAQIKQTDPAFSRMNFHIPDASTLLTGGAHKCHRVQPSGLFFLTDLTPWMDPAPLSVSCKTSMDLVLQLFVKLGCKTVCVVNGAGGGAGKYVGVLTKRRVIALMNE
ncbi:hypothetical protein HDU98_012103 [Podochytrium sp. JEL0797]|nr:hypothetical protein HDU98_012103 [Podochytrium sp. JEL0797]